MALSKGPDSADKPAPKRFASLAAPVALTEMLTLQPTAEPFDAVDGADGD